MTALDSFVAALEARGCRPRRSGSGEWSARCPAHEDRNPSLSFRQADDRILVHCHAGCMVETIVERLGLSWTDLFDEETREWQAPGARVVGVGRNGGPFVVESVRRFQERIEGRGSGDSVSTIVTRDLREAMEQEPDEPEWVWDGYLASGWVTLLAGLPKSGKTTLLCGLLDAFVKGKQFLGRPVAPTGTLILTEQAPGVFKSTLENYGFTFDRVEVAFYREQRTHDWATLIADAVDVCRRKGLNLLVIDTWARWASMQTDHDAAEILRTFAPLSQATKAGLAVLIVHHARKEGGSHGTEVSGRVEITAGVDVILSLSRVGDGRKLLADGRSTKTPERVVFTLDAEQGFQVGDAQSEQTKAVAAALAKLGAATYAELSEETEIPRASVQRALDELRRDGRVLEDGVRGRAKLFRAA